MPSPSPGCRVYIDGALVEQDIWSLDGLIIDAGKRFYESSGHGDFGQPEVIDCGGRIISPGYIDIQINGAFGVDFADTSIGTKDLALVAEVRFHRTRVPKPGSTYVVVVVPAHPLLTPPLCRIRPSFDHGRVAPGTSFARVCGLLANPGLE